MPESAPVSITARRQQSEIEALARSLRQFADLSWELELKDISSRLHAVARDLEARAAELPER